GADEIDELAEAVFVERGPRIIFWQDAFQARVVALDRDHRVVDDFSDCRLFRTVLEIIPTSGGWYPENIFRAVLVGIFWIRASIFAFASDQFRVVLLETIGEVR